MVSNTTLTWYVDLSLSQRAIDGVRTERGSTPPHPRSLGPIMYRLAEGYRRVRRTGLETLTSPLMRRFEHFHVALALGAIAMHGAVALRKAQPKPTRPPEHASIREDERSRVESFTYSGFV